MDAPEILCLQEVGGESRLQVGQTVTRDLIIGDVEYVVYLHNTTKAYHAVAVAVQTRLSPAKPCFTALSVGLAVELFLGPAPVFSLPPCTFLTNNVQKAAATASIGKHLQRELLAKLQVALDGFSGCAASPTRLPR